MEQFFDYGNSIPNLSFAHRRLRWQSLAARGVALRGIQGSNTTGFYIDDTPVLETLDPHIVDIARIEVLRGPPGHSLWRGIDGRHGPHHHRAAECHCIRGQVHVAASGTDHGSLNEIVEGVVNLPLVSAMCSRCAPAVLPVRRRIF